MAKKNKKFYELGEKVVETAKKTKEIKVEDASKNLSYLDLSPGGMIKRAINQTADYEKQRKQSLEEIKSYFSSEDKLPRYTEKEIAEQNKKAHTSDTFKAVGEKFYNTQKESRYKNSPYYNMSYREITDEFNNAWQDKVDRGDVDQFSFYMERAQNDEERLAKAGSYEELNEFYNEKDEEFNYLNKVIEELQHEENPDLMKLRLAKERLVELDNTRSRAGRMRDTALKNVAENQIIEEAKKEAEESARNREDVVIKYGSMAMNPKEGGLNKPLFFEDMAKDIYKIANNSKNENNSVLTEFLKGNKLFYLTDVELGIFNTLYETDPNKAVGFLSELEKFLEKDLAEYEAQKDYEYGKKHPVIGAIKSTVQDVVISPIAALDDLGEYITTGEVDTYDWSGKQIRESENISAGARNYVKENYGEGAALLYDIGTEGIKLTTDVMLAKVPIKAAKYTSYINMGSRAFSHTTIDIMDRGGTSGQAVLMGLLSTAVEIATENMTFDEILDVGSARGVANKFKAAGKAFPKNAMEEIMADVGNGWVDLVVMGNKSSSQTRMSELINNGMSTKDALKQIFNENIMQLVTSGVVGGFVGSGATFASSKASEASRSNYMATMGDEIIGKNPELFKQFIDYGIIINNPEAIHAAENMFDKDIDGKTAGKVISSVIEQSVEKDGGMINIMQLVSAIDGRGYGYIGSQESIDTAKAVMHFVQGKATDVDTALISRSTGATTLLTAIEGNKKAWDSVDKAAGRELRSGASQVQNTEYGVRNGAPHQSAIPTASHQEGALDSGVRYSYAGKTKSGIKKYVTDFPADMDIKTREKVFKERIASVFNLGAVKLNTDTKKIQVMGDRFTEQKNIYGDDIASEEEMQAKVNSLYDIAEVLSDSKFVGKEIEPSYEDSTVKPKNKAHKNVKYWYKFKNTIYMDGEMYDVVFNIRDKGKEQYQYLIEFHKKGDNSNQPYGQNDLRRTLDELSPETRVPQNEESVNSYSMRDGELYSQGKKVSIPKDARIVKNIVLDEVSSYFRKKNPKDYKVIEKMAQDLGMKVKFVKGLFDAKGRILDGVETDEGIFINTEAKNPIKWAATHEFSHLIKQSAGKAWSSYQNFVVDKLKKDGSYYALFEIKALAYGTRDVDYINEEIACDHIGETFDSVDELADFIKKDRGLAVKVRDFYYKALDKLGLLDEKKKAQQLWRDAYRKAVLNVKDGKVEKTGEVKYSKTYSFNKQVDDALDGKMKSGFSVYVGKLPNLLSKCGLNPDLDMLINQGHLRDINHEKDGLHDEYHDIPREIIKQVPELLKRPAAIYDSISEKNKENSVCVLTTKCDKDGNPIIVIIENSNRGSSYLNLKMETVNVEASNYVKSVYGRKGFLSHMNDVIDKDSVLYASKNGMEKLFAEIERFNANNKKPELNSDSKLQLLTRLDNLGFDSIIHQSRNVVNTYSMQNGGKDAKQSISGTRASEILSGENAELRNQIENMHIQLNQAEGKGLDIREIKRVAQDFRKEYGSKVRLSELHQDLTKLYNLMQSDKATADEVSQRISEIADKVIKNATQTVTNDEYSELLDRIKNTKIMVPELERADFRDGYEHFRKSNMGKITLVNDGTDLDVFWDELTEGYPNLFDEEILGSEERLERILEVREEFAPREESVFTSDEEMQVEKLKLENDIMETFFEIPEGESNTKYVFYDKRAAGVEKELADTSKKLDLSNKKTARKEIDSDFNYLSQMVKNPTDAKHVPENMRAGVAALLRCFNYETKYLDKLKDAGKEADSPTAVRIADMYNAYTNIIKASWGIENTEQQFVDQFLSDDLKEMMGEIPVDESGGFKRLEDMSIDELRSMAKVLRSVHHTITQRNKAFNTAIKEEISELGFNTAEDFKSTRARRKGSGEKVDGNDTALEKAVQLVDKYFNYDNAQPWDFFHELGGTMERLYMEERKAFNKHILNIKYASEKLQEATKGIDLDKVTGKGAPKIRFKTSFDEELVLSKGQILSLYALYNRKQGKEHILGGGIVTGKKYYNSAGDKGSANTAHPITEADLGKLFDENISSEEKKMVKAVVEFMSTECAKWGNETSMKLYGYEKFGESWYFPIKVSNQTLNTYYGQKGEGNQRTQSFTKKTTKNATNAVEIGDFFDTVTSHINGVSLYNTTALPMLDMERVLNYTESGSNVKVRADLVRTFGRNAESYIEKFHKDENGSTKIEKSGIEKLANLSKKASIGFNARVLVQQPTSIARAYMFLSPKDIPASFKGAAMIKEMREVCPIAYWKSLGFRDIGTGSSLKTVLLNNESFYSKAEMGLYGLADDFTWGLIYGAVKNETIRINPGIDVNSQEFKDKVRERFDYIVDRTQVVDSVFHRTQNMRSDNAFVRNSTMFMSEALKTYNLYRTELKDAVKEGRKLKTITKATAVFAINNLLLALAQAIPDAWREDDEKELFDENGKPIGYWGMYWKKFKKNLVDDINPLTSFPVIKDVWGIMQGFSSERVEYSRINDLIINFKNLGNDKMSLPAKWTNFTMSTAAVFGISVGNLKRDAFGFAEAVFRATGDEYKDYLIDKFKFNVKNDHNKAKFMRHYERAVTNKHPDDAAMILEDYMAEMFKGKDFKNEHTKAVTEEATKLFKKDDNKSKLLYSLPSEKFSLDGEETEIPDKDYPEFVEGYYNTLYDLAYEMVKDKRYKELSAEDKARSFGELKSYAAEAQRMEQVEGYELSGWEKELYNGKKSFMDSVAERAADREFYDKKETYIDGLNFDESKYSEAELGTVENVMEKWAGYRASKDLGREIDESKYRHIIVYEDKLSNEMPLEEYAGVRAYAKKTAALYDLNDDNPNEGSEALSSKELERYLDSTDYSWAVKGALFEAIGNSNWYNKYTGLKNNGEPRKGKGGSNSSGGSSTRNSGKSNGSRSLSRSSGSTRRTTSRGTSGTRGSSGTRGTSGTRGSR